MHNISYHCEAFYFIFCIFPRTNRVMSHTSFMNNKGTPQKPDNLTDRQWAFVLSYAVKRNATQAAIDAGYSPTNRIAAASMGWENLRKPYIKKALDEIWKSQAMDVHEVLGGLAELARSARAEKDRIRAYELIGRNLSGGLWTDNVSQRGEVTINVEITSSDD